MTRREQLERLYIRLAPLKRLLLARCERLMAEEPVVLESGRPVWLEEEEFQEEAGKLVRVDRLLARVAARLGWGSDDEEGQPELAAA